MLWPLFGSTEEAESNLSCKLSDSHLCKESFLPPPSLNTDIIEATAEVSSLLRPLNSGFSTLELDVIQAQFEQREGKTEFG